MADLLYIASSEKDAKAIKPFSDRLHGNHWFIANGIETAFELCQFIKFDLVFIGDFKNKNIIQSIELELAHLPMVIEASLGNQILRNYTFKNHVTIFDKPLSSVDIMCALLFFSQADVKSNRMIA